MIQLNTDDERDRESQKYFNCENFIHYIKIQNNIELENEEFVNVKHDYRLESKELQ
jgi:hypothetical protein